MSSRCLKQLIAGTAIVLIAIPVMAQDVLPRPEQPFRGVIGRTPNDFKPDFPKSIEAPKGAPNIVLILTDDVGFGAPSTFGGPIPTPTSDRIARDGLRYSQFHTTALCSPTCAALLTGRNHHSVATGVVMEHTRSCEAARAARHRAACVRSRRSICNALLRSRWGRDAGAGSGAPRGRSPPRRAGFVILLE